MIAHHSLHLCFPRGVKKYFLLSGGTVFQCTALILKAGLNKSILNCCLKVVLIFLMLTD
ncbi:hypothetical protein KPHVMX_90045 [Klebsiella pneumoniae]|nr:hypothetical protein KPHVMX_90045 [Klebsiella pneumoniae]